MPNLDTTEKIISIMVGIIALLGLVLTAYRWTRPLKIEPAKLIQFNSGERDAIIAKLTNRGGKNIYVIRCVARGTYSAGFVFRRFIRRPWMHPRFYEVIRFNAFTFSLMSKSEVKLEPGEPTELRHILGDSWMGRFSEPYFLIEATLSTGKIVRSAKLSVPERWRRTSQRAGQAVTSP